MIEQWRRNQYAVLVAIFISFLGVSFVLPFLPLYIQQLGVTDVGEIAFLSGVTFAVAPLASGLLAPLWGVLADRYGVKLMVVRALGSFIVLYILMAMVSHPWQLITLRLGIGVFGGFGPMTASLVTLGVPQREVGAAIGRLQATQILATALGPLIGGVLADRFGIRVAFLYTAFFCVVALLLIVFLYREERDEGVHTPDIARVSIRALFRLPAFGPMLVVLLLSIGVDRAFGPLIPLFVALLDPSVPVASTSGLVFSVGSFVSAVAASQVGRLARRFEPTVLLPSGLLLGLVATAPLLVVDRVWQLVVLRVLFGVASGMTATLVYAAATRMIPQSARSTAFGFLGSATNLATAAGPFAAGAMATISLRATFGAATAVYAAATVLSFLLWRRSLKVRDVLTTG